MRTKVITLLCSATAAAILYAVPAYAEEALVPDTDGGTIEIGLSQGHLDRNYGIDIAPEKALAQTVITYTRGHLTANWSTLTLLSSGRSYGRRGMGDEQQLGLTYHNADETRLGTFEYQGSVAYRFVDMGHNGGTSDDFVEATAQLGYPVKVVGSLKVTPYVRVVKDIPVGHNNPLFWDMGGVRIDGPVLSDARFYVDVTSVHNVNSETAVPHKNVWYAEAGVSRPLGMGIVGTLGATYSQYSKHDTQFEFLPRSDGRLDPFPRLEKDWTRPGPKFFAKLSYEF